jgi:hypothetical protein
LRLSSLRKRTSNRPTKTQDGAAIQATGHGISRQLGLASACLAIAAQLPDFWEPGGGAGGVGGA